tara:strand:- start:767 stop:1555 length:789 start_codon:yes stop_codon:yes gene_type:complete
MAKKKPAKILHFTSLDNNKKIVSIVGIALLISVVASIIPGEPTVTGNAAFDGIFDLMEGFFGGFNGLLTKVFGALEDGDTKIVYAKFLLFLAVTGIVTAIMRTVNKDQPMINVIIGLAIAFLSTMFIPNALLEGTGLVYSGVFLALLNVALLGLLLWINLKIPKSKSGYVAKFALWIITFFMVGYGLDESKNVLTNQNFQSALLILMILSIVASLYTLFRIFTITEKEETEEEAEKATAGALATKISEAIAGAGRKITKKGD